MKALTFLQPWASLTMMGAKKFETRSWKTDFRGSFLIHASAKRPTRAEVVSYNANPLFLDFIPDIEALPYGALIGKCDLVGIYRTEDITDPSTMINIMLNAHEKAFGNFEDGRYAWGLDELQPFKQPIPFKGALRFWEFPDHLLPKELILK